MRASLLVWLLTVASGPTPDLSVTPQVGIGPLRITVSVHVARPEPSDEEIEVMAIDRAADPPLVIRRSARTIYHGPRTRLVVLDSPALRVNIPPAALQATWTLPTGQYAVLACLWPSRRCAREDVEVK